MTRSDQASGAGLWLLIREGFATSRSQPVASAITALLLATVCLSVLATTGQSAASEARVIREVERAGSRTLTVNDSAGAAGLSQAHVQAAARLPQVEWLLGLGPPADVFNTILSDAGSPVPSRPLATALPPPVKLASGRFPRAGEAIAGQAAARHLGLSDGVGAVSNRDREVPVVGTFTARSPLTGLNDLVLIRQSSGDGRERLQSVYVLARTVEDVPALEVLLPGTLSVTDPSQLTIDSPTALAQLQQVVGGEVGRNSRRLMLMVLGGGLLLVAMTQYGATMARRRDYGRRRALGASRTDLVLLVVVQALSASLVGVLIGLLGGLLVVRVLTGEAPSWQFSIGVGILAVLTALIAAVPPSVLAARADPVRILRVP